MSIKEEFVKFATALQHKICYELEVVDGSAKFLEDKWKREGGGGGVSRIMSEGSVFEKAGVNISFVEGIVTPALAQQLKTTGTYFFASGISLVIHPLNPMVPTTHANFRYFELYNDVQIKIDSWFGGGADLTPYYLNEQDVIHFHSTLKSACDASDEQYYPQFKKLCDGYFNNTHRGNERRGVGGIFYDYVRPDSRHSEDQIFDFSKACANSVLDAYLPIVINSKDLPYTEEQVRWQHIRRGRYVEFNLLHDRGTLFGLKSNGRTESILMSLPPRVRFDYNDEPEEGSAEAKLIEVLRNPRSWC
jgi:coproporphyrinogen III oxidase